MRTRDKMRVPVKARCFGCGVGVVIGNAAEVAVGTRVERECKHCGGPIRKIISQDDLDQAVDKFVENRDFARRLATGEVKSGTTINHRPDPKRDRSLPTREKPTARRRVRSDQVSGAPKLYHYAVYVRHPWGTDRIVVGTKKRLVQAARDEAYDKVSRVRKTGDLKIMDAVPMKWTEDGWVETRRTRVIRGNLKQVRKPKSRASARQTKRKANGR